MDKNRLAKEGSGESRAATTNHSSGLHTSAVYPPVKLATAYVPRQRYGAIYSPAEALKKGTLFPELYRPYP
ncbi:MAG TPA: hypothetical protein DCM26_02415 [Desulfotomaculum sp.]|nr:hypothetical protein [Desulfotomaculum sp.]